MSNLNPESKYLVFCDGKGVACVLPDGSQTQMSWDEMRAILIETNDSGPFGTDVWWILIGHNRHISIPQGATGEQELIDEMQKLPSFDNKMFVLAMMSTSNQRFLCWDRKNTTSA